MPGLRVLLLGPPRFERDGAAFELGRRKNVALVAFLAVTGERHSREALITLLWPELEPSAARHNLRRNLAILRKKLGEEWLVADQDSLGLDTAAGLWVDVDHFRALVQAWRAHGHMEASPCSQCLMYLEEAVALCRGDFLAGFGLVDSAAFDDWQFFEGEGLRRELASALARLVEAYNARGSFDEAIGYARRWLALDPLHEPVQRRLMQLYAQAGQRAAALRQYDECVRLLQEELGLPPAEETTALYEEIRAERPAQGELLAPARQPRHNLPVQPTPFVGREAALAAIEAHLQDPACRLLTLVGPGGCGKTRLALEAAARRLPQFPDGAFFVPLASLRSPESIVPTVAQVLGLSTSGARDPQQRLLAFLREKRILLLLDSFEHLLADPGRDEGDGSGLITAILGAAPGVKALVTSRAALRLQHEQLFPVGGMDYPGWAIKTAGGQPTTDAFGYGAVRLFVQSARRVAPGFQLGDDNLADVVRICRLVDGLPLAIVLAAAWVRVLAPHEVADQIAAELGGGIDFLVSDARDMSARHRSMRAVFDHSWRLLGERERDVLAALSVFRGGFTRQAARAVAGALLGELRSLVDRSLVQPRPRTRYDLHELLRQYAEERLGESVQASENVRDRHAAFYIAALEQLGRDLRGSLVPALAEMDAETENARAAWHRAAEQAQVELLDRGIDGLGYYCLWRGRFWEQEADFGAAAARLADLVSGAGRVASADGVLPDSLPAGEALRVLGRTVGWQGAASYNLGHLEVARELWRRSLALLERSELTGQDARRERARVLVWMAADARDRDWEESRRFIEHSAALYRALGDIWDTVHVRVSLALAEMHLGHWERARSLTQATLAWSRGAGSSHIIEWSLWVLCCLALAEGERAVGAGLSPDLPEAGGPREAIAEARRLAQECVAAMWEHGNRQGSPMALAVLATAERELGDLDQARQHVCEALRICGQTGLFEAPLYALPVVALLVAQEGAKERAVELYALVSRPLVAKSRWFELVFGRHIAAVAACLPTGVAAEAEVRGHDRDLWATVDELAAELGG